MEGTSHLSDDEVLAYESSDGEEDRSYMNMYLTRGLPQPQSQSPAAVSPRQPIPVQDLLTDDDEEESVNHLLETDDED